LKGGREMRKMQLYIERYGETKFYGLYDAEKKINELPWGQLIAVFVYKRGAQNVKRMLEEFERVLEVEVLESEIKRLRKERER
jgi:hypothetical protein